MLVLGVFVVVRASARFAVGGGSLGQPAVARGPGRGSQQPNDRQRDQPAAQRGRRGICSRGHGRLPRRDTNGVARCGWNERAQAGELKLGKNGQDRRRSDSDEQHANHEMEAQRWRRSAAQNVIRRKTRPRAARRRAPIERRLSPREQRNRAAEWFDPRSPPANGRTSVCIDVATVAARSGRQRRWRGVSNGVGQHARHDDSSKSSPRAPPLWASRPAGVRSIRRRRARSTCKPVKMAINCFMTFVSDGPWTGSS